MKIKMDMFTALAVIGVLVAIIYGVAFSHLNGAGRVIGLVVILVIVCLYIFTAIMNRRKAENKQIVDLTADLNEKK